jgi:hypothetical protein
MEQMNDSMTRERVEKSIFFMKQICSFQIKMCDGDHGLLFSIVHFLLFLFWRSLFAEKVDWVE